MRNLYRITNYLGCNSVMTARNPKILMYEVIQAVQELNRISESLMGNAYKVFPQVSINYPKFKPAELGFILVVSWLYVHYFETGKVGVEFLESKLDVYIPDGISKYKDHRKLVKIMRTFHHHHLNWQSDRDKKTQEICESWFNSTSATKVPRYEKQWRDCLIKILEDSYGFLCELITVLRGIERDESREEICKQWMSKVDRNFSPNEVDKIISIVANDMGIDYINPMKFRTQFYERWSNQMRQLSENCDLPTEARRIVEHLLITNAVSALPITGKDILNTFEISPGPKVRQLLEEARKSYDLNPCSKDILLNRLGEIIKHTPQ